jgi:hypothetical protein
MTMRALVSSDGPVVRIWHPDNPKLYVEIQFESQEAANTAVEQLNGMLKYATGARVRRGRPVLTQAELGISWREAAARRIGGDELKWWPALLQSLLGLQCQSRPSAAYVQKNGLQSRIRRVCHHPLTVSGPKPAFKWSKHRRPPKSGEQSARTTTVRVWRGGTLRTLLCPTYSIVARVKHTVCPVLDAALLDFDLCCADDTLFGVVPLPRAGRHHQGLPT